MFVPGVTRKSTIRQSENTNARPKRRLFGAGFLVSACVALAVGLSAHSGEPAHELAIDLDGIIETGPHANAFWGVYVRDLESGTVLYERNANRPLIPASNQKLLTAATALMTLGPDFKYRTPLLFEGRIEDSVLTGDLVIEGSGDPTFGSRTNDGVREDPFDTWVAALQQRGVKKIEGRIIGNDDIFDDDAFGDGWDVSHIGRYGFAAPSGGISYRDNIVRVEIAGYRSGRAPRVEAEPDGYLHIANDVRTNSSRWSRRLDVERPFGTESIQLSGLVSRRFRGSLEIPGY